MGWGIEFTKKLKSVTLNRFFEPLVYIHKPRFSADNIAQLNDAIEELEDDIREQESQIRMYFAADPLNIVPNSWNDDPVIWLNSQANGLLQQLRSDQVELYKLRLYKEYLQEKKNEQ